MKNWEYFEDDVIYNENEKRTVAWTTYGHDTKYFLSREYSYDSDPIEMEGDSFVLVNEEITKENTIEKLIKKTKAML